MMGFEDEFALAGSLVRRVCGVRRICEMLVAVFLPYTLRSVWFE